MNSKKTRNICIVLMVLVLFIYTTIFVNSCMNNNKIGLFSIKLYIMSSDSEESNINSGDLVIAKNIRVEEIKKDDIIIFKKDNQMLVKKVTEVNNSNGKLNFFVQEDEITSNEKLEDVEIIGKIISNIKGVGNVALFMKSPLGIINILLIIICIFIIVKKLTRDSQKDANNEEE